MSNPSSSHELVEKFNAISTKDKILLVIMIVVVLGVGCYFLMNHVNKSLDKKMHETDEYRDALAYIADNYATYEKNREQKAAMRDKLLSADTKIVSKLSSMASNLGFDVTVTPKDPHEISDASGAEEQEIEVQLKGVDYDKCLEYIIQIHKLDTPIYMRHLNIQRSSNNTTTDTKMTVSITLMSYRLKEQNAT